MYRGENKVIEVLQKPLSIKIIAQETGLNEDSVRRIVESLKERGFVRQKTETTSSHVPTEELVSYATGKQPFPEHSVFLKSLKGASVAGLDPAEKSIGIRWAKQHGFVAIEGGKLQPTKTEEEVESHIARLKKTYDEIAESGTCNDELKPVCEEFIRRKLVDVNMLHSITVELTGKKYSATGFDVNVPGPDAPLGKNHPITSITRKMKAIMTELGFEEIEGSIVESSFWNFDALFQPQDHPARELADTFYLNHKSPLPQNKLVERVKKAHEEGWKYKWNPENAQKSVLRTHTTSLSARSLAALKDKKPRKFFAIGRVFRNEATDYSHLAEFHQVEGIIAWEGAKFTDLLGILKLFYSKLGFEKIQFRPSYFPYTEPSLEIEVYFEEKKKWMELGGAGIFRPEVSIPLAGIYPVLAWGLSLERPLMLALELDDIRTFYKNDLDFLKRSRLDL
ncbi:phenylalanine--tRNA ligase subunit alpha [Candidatus Micrarchaeota archaeon]|nr:phenylalanine--tRNA ligase subunit alpha [Candidatus Micrarchaeota archaeon]